jgi:hypothetical protein
VKESIIKIIKPIQKAQPQPGDEEQLQPQLMPSQEISLTEESLQPQTQPKSQLQPQPQPQTESTDIADIAHPAQMRFVIPDASGWKVSDILREIRLDNFQLDDDINDIYD